MHCSGAAAKNHWLPRCSRPRVVVEAATVTTEVEDAAEAAAVEMATIEVAAGVVVMATTGTGAGMSVPAGNVQSPPPAPRPPVSAPLVPTGRRR